MNQLIASHLIRFATAMLQDETIPHPETIAVGFDSVNKQINLTDQTKPGDEIYYSEAY